MLITFTVLAVLGLIIGVTAYACRNSDGQLTDGRTSL
jgi:hypothetical protein